MSDSECTKTAPIVKYIEYKCIQQSGTIYRIDKRLLYNGITDAGAKCDFWTDWLGYAMCGSGQSCSDAQPQGKCGN